MGSELKFEVLTWKRVYNMILDLSGKIQKTGFKPDVIVGVARGGWVPARILSDLLSNTNVASVRAEFYTAIAETKCEPMMTQSVSVSVAEKMVLVVDEVADTGKTLKLIKDHVVEQGASQVKTAAVYSKPWSVFIPDYYEKESSSWIVFPWEIKETVRKILRKRVEKEASFEKEKARLVEYGIPVKLVERFLKEIVEEDNC